MKVEDQEKYDKDTVTLLHNGKPLFYRNEINDHNRELRVRLDTGRNLFIFFADNLAAFHPIPAIYIWRPVENRMDLIAEPVNVWGTFLVADVYFKPKEKNPIVQKPIAQNDLNDVVAKRTTEPVATIAVDTADIVLELWDGEVQDGDSISLRLNGKWVATGFPVRNACKRSRSGCNGVKMNCCSWPTTLDQCHPIPQSFAYVMVRRHRCCDKH